MGGLSEASTWPVTAGEAELFNNTFSYSPPSSGRLFNNPLSFCTSEQDEFGNELIWRYIIYTLQPIIILCDF